MKARRTSRIALLLVVVGVNVPAIVFAQEAAVGSLRGVVVDQGGRPVPGAHIVVMGFSATPGKSEGDGGFSIEGLPSGVYSIEVSRAGFKPDRRSGISVPAREGDELRVVMTAASFSSLQTIGSTVANESRRGINASSTSVASVPGRTSFDQGQAQLANLLNEIPGILTTHVFGNGASEGAAQVPMIRGALGYETESLVDGHPVSIGATGTYNPMLISPALLQDVEVVKGPGAFPTAINSAIGGTVNYRTLEPTKDFRSSFVAGSDQYGGVSTSATSTGWFASHFLSYAAGIATNGTTGPLNNYEVPSGSQTFGYLGSAPYTVNGQQIAATTINRVSPNPPTPQFAGPVGQIRFSEPLYFCCSALNTGFHQVGELAKLRLNFSQRTALTLTYLGGQAEYDDNGSGLVNVSGQGIQLLTFSPRAGYSGSVPAGTSIPWDNNAGRVLSAAAQTSLNQAELRTALGPLTLLGRYYGSYERDLQFSPSANASTLDAWGKVPLCPHGDVATTMGGCNLPTGATGPAPTVTSFNGQSVTIGGSGPAGETLLTDDESHGYSFEVDGASAADFYTLSYDRSVHVSNEFLNSPIAGINAYQIPIGSGQGFATLAGHADLPIADKLSATIGYYLVNYTSHFSGDGGATFSDASHSWQTPRVAFVGRPNVDTSIRLSAGGSIAPPYISLISAPRGAPVPNVPAAPTFFNENVNDGQIRPETAFGYDLGADRRYHSLRVSSDLYLTNVRNVFLPSTYHSGTYTCTSGACIGQTAPLYLSQTENLGNARYEGLELEVKRDVPVGIGWRVEGALIRAFAYNVSSSIYATSAGPLTTNLAVIPNVNFQPSGSGYNGIENIDAGYGRVPYAQGYAEINYRNAHGLYANIGVLYYGSDNTYNVPAFGVLSGSFRVPVTPNSSLQLSAYNITGAYSNSWNTQFGGINVPLVNGTLGTTAAGNIGPTTWRLFYRVQVVR